MEGDGLVTIKRPAPGSLREQQQVRAKESLLRATLDIISATGSESVSIERVTLTSGMSRGTLYAHCPGGREELLQRAYDHIGQAFTHSAEAASLQRIDWKDRIAAHAEAMARLCEDPRIGIFYNISGPNLGLRSSGGKGSKATQEFFTRELSAARQDGPLDAGVDPAGTAILLTGCLREMGMAVALEANLAPGLVESFRRILAGLSAIPAAAMVPGGAKVVPPAGDLSPAGS